MDRDAAILRARLPVFQRRVEEARRIIDNSITAIKRPYLSCSFGKDSVVLLHLVHQRMPNIPVVFINSQYCFPDTYVVRDEFIKEYNINLVEIKQPHDYIDIINTYGLPDDRTPAQQQKVVDLLKKDLANVWAHENGYDGCFWGLRKEEARGRKWLLNVKGSLFFADSAKLWRSAPLANWTWDDIWAYIHYFGVPYSGIYDKTRFCDPKHIRNTSWVTTDGAAKNGRVVWLKYYYPDLYNRLVSEIPEIRRYV